MKSVAQGLEVVQMDQRTLKSVSTRQQGDQTQMR